MRKMYAALFTGFVFLSLTFFVLPGCQSNKAGEIQEFEEADEYDGPDKAIEFELERLRDPNTGRVPWEKLLIAIQRTELAKQQSRTENIQALSWIERGPSGDFPGPSGNSRPAGQQTAGRIRAVMVDSLDPTHKTVFVGSVSGGLWKTTDITSSPANWVLVNDFLSNLAVSDLAQDPRPGFQNIMYMATGESFSNIDAVRGVGVFKSTDAGSTWNFLPSTSSFVSGTRIVCDAQGNVYLGTRNTGLQRSNDGGLTWTTITPTGIGSSVCDLELSSTGRMHVTTGIFSQSGYAWTDNPSTVTALSWNLATSPFTTFNQRTELAVSGNVLYACPDNSSHQVPNIWKSTDGGIIWAITTAQPSTTWASGQGWYSLSAGINPANTDELIVGGLDTWKTTNGGSSWTKISSWATSTTGFYVHADQHDIQWYDGGSKLIMACDGGIHYSSNSGTSFTDRNQGLRIKQFYSVAIHPTQTNYFIAGAQDNGMHRIDHVGLDSSIEFYGGDGCFAAIDQNEPQFQFGSYVYNVFRRSTNNGATWSTPVSNQSSGRFVNPWDLDNIGNKIYSCNNAGTFRRWDDPQTGGTTVVVTVPQFGSGNVSAVHVSPYTPDRVYFGLGSGGAVVMVDNAATGTTATGTVLTPTGATGYVNSVVTGSSDQHLIATVTTYGATHVWYSNNGGTTWSNVQGNLPDMPVYSALFHPDSDTKAYIATETGVWETDLLNGSSTVWNANPTFPNVRTDMIRYRASDRTIAAGTHGRGIWSAVVAPPSGFSLTTPAAVTANCPAPASMDAVLSTVSNGGFTNPITLSATGAPAGTSINFVPGNTVTPGNNVTVRLNNANTLAPGTYTITVTGTATGSPNQVVNLTYTINPGAGPVITTQPGNQTICAGANTSFSITSASATAFQWELSTNGGTTWTPVTNGGVYSGATTNTLSLASVPNTYTGNLYRVKASTFCGSTTSTIALLTVNTPPVITTQPADATLCSGTNNTFTVAATGTGLTYQWQLSANGCSGPWTNIPGATTSSYTITGVTAVQNNTGYRVIVSGNCTPVATSNCALLTVVTSVSITAQPASQTICEGSNASFTVAGSGSGIIYQWQVSTDGGSTWSNVTDGGNYSGAGTGTLVVSNTPVSMNNYRYRAQLTNASCSTPSVSASGILTVNTLPVISSQPQSATICAGADNNFNVTASGTGITYQWQLSTDGGVTWTNITGANTSGYSVTGASVAMNNNRYRVVVSGTCAPAATSNAATLNVIAPVTISTQPAGKEVCSGDNSTFSVTASSTQTIIYQWQVSTDGGTNWTNITGANASSYTVNNAQVMMNNNRYRVQVSNATCTQATTSSAATLIVRQLPSVGLTAAPLTELTPGKTTTLTATPSASTGGTLTTTWYRDGSVFAQTGNSFLADVSKLGAYQVKIQESFSSGLTCFSESPIVTISAAVSSQLFIFPSPNDGQFKVSYYNSAGTGTSRTITIYDSKGSKVYNGKFSITGAYTLIDIDLRPAQRGIYYVMVRTVNGEKLAEGKVMVNW